MRAALSAPRWRASVPAMLLAGLVLSACGGSAYGRCRAGAALHQDAVTRELALNRCEHVANRELLRKMRREEDRRERESRKARADKRHHDVRARPEVVELGATPKESAAVCGRQGGLQRDVPGSGGRFICSVAGVPIYTALLQDQVVYAVTAFYEDGNLTSMRAQMESGFGPPDYWEIRNGYRFWICDTSNPQAELGSYDSGVTLTLRDPGLGPASLSSGKPAKQPAPIRETQSGSPSSSEAAGDPATLVRENPF